MLGGRFPAKILQQNECALPFPCSLEELDPEIQDWDRFGRFGELVHFRASGVVEVKLTFFAALALGSS